MLDWMVELLGLPERFRFDERDRGRRDPGVGERGDARGDLLGPLAGHRRAPSTPTATRPASSPTPRRRPTRASRRACASPASGPTGCGSCPTTRRSRCEPDALAEAIAADRAAGLVPFFVCATHGTTSSMAFDPTPEIGPLCRSEGLWLHVDAAMSGIAALAPEHRWVNEGLEHADSYCTNPHKWMGVNFDCDLYWTADRTALLGALSILPEYLRSAAAETGAAIDYRDWQVPLGRRFRALKLWLTIRLEGVAAIQAMIRRHVELTQRLAALVARRRPVRDRRAAPAEPALHPARRRRRRDRPAHRAGQRDRVGAVHPDRARRPLGAPLLDRHQDDRVASRRRGLAAPPVPGLTHPRFRVTRVRPDARAKHSGGRVRAGGGGRRAWSRSRPRSSRRRARRSAAAGRSAPGPIARSGTCRAGRARRAGARRPARPPGWPVAAPPARRPGRRPGRCSSG